MNNAPRLSLIVPMYNAGAHFFSLRENVIPLLNRTDIEILLVNDGSKDNTLALAQQFATEAQNVRVLDKSNGGAAAARNFGIRNATGVYLAFLDADDKMDFTIIESLLQQAEKGALELIAFDLRYIDTSGNLQGQGLQQLSQYNILQSGIEYLDSGYQPSSICIFLAARNFILTHELFFVEGITHEDVEVSLRWMLAAQKVIFTKEVGYFYFQHPGSVTNQLTAAKKQKYLMDEVIVAGLMKRQMTHYTTAQAQYLIRKNYNSVVWNLLFIIYKDPAMLDHNFVKEVIARLKKETLYPIRGPLKTTFQKLTKFIINIEFVLKRLLGRKLK